MSALQQLNGADVLLNVCADLAYLKRYMSRYESAVRGEDYVMPVTLAEATTIRSRCVHTPSRLLKSPRCQSGMALLLPMLFR